MPSGANVKPRKRKADPDEVVTFEQGSGNVFADIGLPDPDILLAKAGLVRRIERLIEARGLSGPAAARLLRITPDRLAALVGHRTERYTLDRLFRFLTALGQRVEVAVRPTPDGAAAEVVVQ